MANRDFVNLPTQVQRDPELFSPGSVEFDFALLTRRHILCNSGSGKQRLRRGTMDNDLSPRHWQILTELATNRSGGRFDSPTLCELFSLGLVEIRPDDRRLILSERGKKKYRRREHLKNSAR